MIQRQGINGGGGCPCPTQIEREMLNGVCKGISIYYGALARMPQEGADPQAQEAGTDKQQAGSEPVGQPHAAAQLADPEQPAGT